MLTTVRGADGTLLAACDWWLVDSAGVYDVKGSWVYVEQLELAPTRQRARVIHQVIADIAERVPWACGAYWERRDKRRGDYRSYVRRQLIREGVWT